ncbi:hypothetical protein AR158_c232L [Paramecium bursaria Chlorella virus AR158]|uniref:hypothetical protein n=1 Tax=Paramecium bursaria Chlorella virus AR158 TaxID=380598 RepID=UPI00015AA882|nr:hypothetical protein AR158_c232L [Paramecium bursaria Chlorella virus AR158]ABU43778.1 hypothetical protein AR158_c232L [Paramecium bursaria Chlorella virus AR158]
MNISEIVLPCIISDTYVSFFILKNFHPSIHHIRLFCTRYDLNAFDRCGLFVAHDNSSVRFWFSVFLKRCRDLNTIIG